MENALNLKDKVLYIWNHAGFQKYFKNTGWLFSGRIFSLAISFFVGIYIARYLGPANYGLMNYAISFVGLFGFLASLGIDEIVGRNIIRNHELKDKIIGTAFFIKIFGALLAIFITITISVFTIKETFTILLITIFSLHYIPQAFNVIEIYFQSQVLSKKFVRAQISSGLISASLKLLVIFLNKGIFWLIFIYVVEISLLALFLIFAFLKNGNHFRCWKFDKEIAFSLLKDSWPIILSGMATGIYMKISPIIINEFLDNKSNGIYAIAVKLSEVWYIIPTIVTTSLFPAIINSIQNNKIDFENKISKLYFMMFWVSASISICTILFSNKIINIFFGSEYIQSVLILQIYILSLIAVSIGSVISKYLVAKNLMSILLFTTIIGAVSNILLNVILIPKIGVLGAAIATVTSYIIVSCSIIFFKESRPHFFLIIKSIFKFKF
jgi:O-antigen/teichoic acid export membrane protein